jgi:hypothetical protein
MATGSNVRAPVGVNRHGNRFNKRAMLVLKFLGNWQELRRRHGDHFCEAAAIPMDAIYLEAATKVGPTGCAG